MCFTAADGTRYWRGSRVLGLAVLDWRMSVAKDGAPELGTVSIEIRSASTLRKTNQVFLS